jgi:hypothetical protein
MKVSASDQDRPLGTSVMQEVQVAWIGRAQE